MADHDPPYGLEIGIGAEIPFVPDAAILATGT
jgi:hypothetical protein